MTRLTRGIVVLIALGLCAWMLTGCGGDNDTDDNGNGGGNGGNGSDPTPDVTVTGRVISLIGEVPIGGALVTLGGQSTTTDALGQFSFDDVPLGTHTLVVSAPGFIFGPPVNVTIEEGLNDLGTIPLTTSGEGPPPPPPI